MPESAQRTNVILIGYRATGKTTVARHLAQRLGWEWIDADVEIELRAGASIAQIFEDVGEAGFRQLEQECLSALCRRSGLVLALGGGAVLLDENRQLIRRSGRVVWLVASPETIWTRITGDTTTPRRRPNLTNTGGRTEVEQLLAQRTPIYRQCADLHVDTDGKAPLEVADEIIERLDLPPVTTD